MMRLVPHAVAVLLVAASPWSHSQSILKPVEGRLHLFNGHTLDGWVPFLPGMEEKVEANWEVRDDGVLHCAGMSDGYLRTEHSYSNYRLTLQWRWPRSPGESGVMLHVEDEDAIWPRSLEAGISSGHAGDFWVVRSTFDEREESERYRTEKLKESSELPAGEWNSLEVICGPETIEVFVNGVLQNRATHPTVERGHIALQSAGTPIQFRNIVLHPIEPPAGRKSSEARDGAEESPSNRNS